MSVDKELRIVCEIVIPLPVCGSDRQML